MCVISSSLVPTNKNRRQVPTDTNTSIFTTYHEYWRLHLYKMAMQNRFGTTVLVIQYFVKSTASKYANRTSCPTSLSKTVMTTPTTPITLLQCVRAVGFGFSFFLLLDSLFFPMILISSSILV